MASVAGVAPSTLLRALRKHAVRDHDDETEDESTALSIGVLLGSRQSVQAEESVTQRVTLVGVVRAEADLDDVAQYLPGGIAAVGHFAVLQRAAADDDEAIQAFAQRVGTQRITHHDHGNDDEGDGLVLVYVRSSDAARLFRVSNVGSTLTLTLVVSLSLKYAVAMEIVECLHAQDFLQATSYALMRCALHVIAPSPADLEREVQRWKMQLLNDTDQVFFRVASGSKPVFDGDGIDVTTASNTTSRPLSTLLKSAAKQQQSSETSKVKKNAKKKSNNAAQAALDAWDDEPTGAKRDTRTSDRGLNPGYLKTLEYGEIANIEVLCSLAPSSSSDKGLASAPLLTIPDARAPVMRHSSVHLHADVLVLVPVQSTVAQVIRLVRERLSQQLTQLENHFHSSSVVGSNAVHAHHFALVGTAFPLTLLSIPTASEPDSHSTLHENLSEAFLQPLNQPLFHASLCSLVTNSELLGATDVLFNVHEGIPASGVAHGQQFLVDGFYGYYHYMQQSMNDKGWGCAYRSLQTLASWLHLNHFTATASLSHREIQETLVKIGDKPASFVGSKDWIGSMEVGYVLDELFGVAFRNVNVPSGPRLVEKAQELKHHFATQGTPVMMGGGNLAFTLLGIDYNESSGDCAFLILDPHYTGSEDLSAIQTKAMALEGYKAIPCGWRKASTFAKNSFYNLCLPQRPQQL